MSESNRQLYAVAIVSIVALALLNGIALYYAASRSAAPALRSETGVQTNVISVSGSGTASADPDLAYVSVSVLTSSTTATDAQDKNADTMRKVIDALKRIGVADGDLRTEYYSLQPTYGQDKEPRIVGYECRNTLRVTWRRVKEVGAVLDEAVKAGANIIGGVTFALSEQKIDALTAEAIKNAVAEADAKAQAIALAMGVRIVGKISASTEVSYVPLRQTYELKAGATPIIPGELQLTLTVYVNYRFL